MSEYEKNAAVSKVNPSLTRRVFLGNVAMAAASTPLLGAGTTTAADPAPASAKNIRRKVKLGVVGCGGRGHWIADLFKKHGGFELYALADYFQDAVDRSGDALQVEKVRRFTGLSSCRRLIESGVEAVALENVAYFHPQQAKDAVEAGCHVYLAKPIAVDVPGCLAVEAAGRLATQKKRSFLVDYQLPLMPANIEVANRIHKGGLGPLAHILSFSLTTVWPDPPKGTTIENRLRGGIWPSDIPLAGDGIVAYDIHIIDGVTWVMGKRPASACGRSRICRPNPHGDRTDCSGMVYEYEDGVLWTHMTQSLGNNADLADLSASFFGLSATGHIQYSGKVYVRGGPEHYVGTAESTYDQARCRT